MFSLRKYRQFAKDDRGSNAVEFALLALPFFGLILGIIQLGIIFLANQSLDSAVDTAAREIRTGQTRSDAVGLAAFRTALCDNISIVRDCEQVLQVSIQAFDSIEDTTSATLYVDNAPIITTDYETGDGGDVVVINAAVAIPVVGGSLFGAGNGTGSTRLTTSLVFTNENFAELVASNASSGSN
ncbi:MAG: TadE/TadG family type IV pilus assembly protein [Hyphomicrobiales bacterium]